MLLPPACLHATASPTGHCWSQGGPLGDATASCLPACYCQPSWTLLVTGPKFPLNSIVTSTHTLTFFVLLHWRWSTLATLARTHALPPPWLSRGGPASSPHTALLSRPCCCCPCATAAPQATLWGAAWPASSPSYYDSQAARPRGLASRWTACITARSRVE